MDGGKILGAMLVGGIAFAAAVRVAKAKPSGTSASVALVVTDMDGVPVPHHSPAALVAGNSYQVRLTITNTSTQGGTPVAASLDYSIVVTGGSPPVSMLSTATQGVQFGTNEALTFTHTFTVPADLIGSGSAYGAAYAPGGAILGEGSESLSISPPPVYYTLSIGTAVGGTTTPSGLDSYLAGTVVEVQAFPDDGYQFVGWSDGPVVNPRSITMTGDISITPVFEQIPPPPIVYGATVTIGVQ